MSIMRNADDTVKIEAVDDGGQAMQLGVRPNSIVLSVGGQSVAGLDYETTRAIIIQSERPLTLMLAHASPLKQMLGKARFYSQTRITNLDHKKRQSACGSKMKVKCHSKGEAGASGEQPTARSALKLKFKGKAKQSLSTDTTDVTLPQPASYGSIWSTFEKSHRASSSNDELVAGQRLSLAEWKRTGSPGDCCSSRNPSFQNELAVPADDVAEDLDSPRYLTRMSSAEL